MVATFWTENEATAAVWVMTTFCTGRKTHQHVCQVALAIKKLNPNRSICWLTMLREMMANSMKVKEGNKAD